jgi:heat-inducible transcriptional repressor
MLCGFCFNEVYEMSMDERKKRILQAIIDDYIDTAEPIGSRTIARKHELGLSSATIRNEMADLEEMGYLAQPHTSAGRVPSDKGYRLYVDQLMQVYDLQDDEIEKIKTAMELHINELSQLIRQASAVLSRFTKYTSVAVASQMKTSTVKAVQLVPIEADKAMVIVVTNAGIVKNNIVKTADQLRPEALVMISNALNDKLGGLSVEKANRKISSGLVSELEMELGIRGELFASILSCLAGCINQIDNTEVYVEGTTNVLNHPEFRDIIKAKEFMSMLDEKTSIGRIVFDASDSEGGIIIRIGSENDLSDIKDCSLVTTNYNIANTFIGTIGLIGPTRMEYPKVVSSIGYIRKFMNREIGRFLGLDIDNDL